VGESDTTVLGELIHPRTQESHRGVKKSPMDVLGSPSQWFLREERWGKRKMVKGYVLSWGGGLYS
jgi:hypothetical protein